MTMGNLNGARRRVNGTRLAWPGIETRPLAQQRAESRGGSVRRLSVIMAVYNEERTVRTAVEEVLSIDVPCDLELIVVDDGSTDQTPRELARVSDSRLRVYRHTANLGKGTAIHTGTRLATGSHILPFDADLEYSAEDIPRLLEPILSRGCPVVYGTRQRGANTVYASFRYAYGNRLLTLLTNVLFDSAITDLHTCLKLVSADLLKELPLRETGFGRDTELTAALLRRGIRPFEVPISYHGRTHDEGKKIGWRDAVQCVVVLSRVRVIRPRTAPPPPRVVIDLTDQGRAPDASRGEQTQEKLSDRP